MTHHTKAAKIGEDSAMVGMDQGTARQGPRLPARVDDDV